MQRGGMKLALRCHDTFYSMGGICSPKFWV